MNNSPHCVLVICDNAQCIEMVDTKFVGLQTGNHLHRKNHIEQLTAS
jgi:hypothetical protein